MSKKRKPKNRYDPQKRSMLFFADSGRFMEFCDSGYIRLADNPEVRTGVSKIADLISSMTIHLMQNTENGDVRIRNGLSRMIDIAPNPWMTRKTFISNIVRSLLLEGNGNAVVAVKTKQGYYESLVPVPPSSVSFSQNFDGYGYKIFINGAEQDPQDLIHIVINPNPDFPYVGEGYKTVIKPIVDNLVQAQKTEKGFLQDKWKPSLIIKVNAYDEDLKDPERRGDILDDYITSNEAGKPWLIPAAEFDIQEVRPLSLQDIALPETVKLNQSTVAAILGVPAFIFGIGKFSVDEWNNFIDTKILTIAQAIEQEFTKKLLWSEGLYFKMNPRSLYSYNLKDLAEIGSNLYVRGIMTGNEVRNWISLDPSDKLNELIILENFIHVDQIDEQKKLNQKKGGKADENEGDESSD